jgi:hypothetical protein
MTRQREVRRAFLAVSACYGDGIYNYEDVTHIRSEHGLAIIIRLHRAKRVYIAFKGTGGSGFWGNVLDDLKAWPAKPDWDRPGRVHAGFQHHLRELMAAGLGLELADITGSGYSVVLTGFSLGGALAALAAEEIRTFWGLNPKVITFAAPPVGTRKYAASQGPITRVVLDGDAIPALAPWFSHPKTAELILLPGGGRDFSFEHSRDRYRRVLKFHK